VREREIIHHSGGGMVIPFSKKETGIQGLENRYMTLAVVAGVITEER